MRFVHTSDWHVGASFRFADDASQVLTDERLDAITRLGELALREGAADILVAGDVYDVETPSERTLLQPIERMRAFSALRWHLIPGNHDAHTPRGPWERLKRRHGDLPANISLHLTPAPVPLAGGATLLPAVLIRRQTIEDPTAWMNDAASPPGAIRIGLAHGSVKDFGSFAGDTPNLIAIDRADQAGLAYLALGDYHGASSIGTRCAYSGTPETDDFTVGGNGGGTAFVVDIAGPDATPTVTPHRTGRFAWHRLDATLHSGTDVDVLEARLRSLAPALDRTLVWLRASGGLSLEARDAFERRIRMGIGSALRVLRVDDSALLPQPTPADLAAIDHAGFVREAADRLAARAADPADPAQAVAAAALQRLFLLSRQFPSGGGP